MPYTGKKHKNYIWIPKAKSDLKEYRDALRLCSILENRDGSFNDKTLGRSQVDAGAVFNGSRTAEEYLAKYETKQLGDQSYVSSARMTIRMSRFFGWIRRDAVKRSSYFLTERGRFLSSFGGKFPSKIGNFDEFEIFLDDIVTFRFFSVDDNPQYQNRMFQTLPCLQILRFLEQFGYMHHYELAITALTAKNIGNLEFEEKSSVIESLRNHEFNIDKALEYFDLDPTNNSTLTGIYDGPKVLCSLLYQLSLLKTIEPGNIPGASEYYESIYTGHLINNLPHTVFVITDFGKEIIERYKNIVPIWFHDIADPENKYTISSILAQLSKNREPIRVSLNMCPELDKTHKKLSMPIDVQYADDNLLVINTLPGATVDFKEYRDIPPEERSGYLENKRHLNLFDDEAKIPDIQVQIPKERFIQPRTSHCLKCYPAPCIYYAEHFNVSNSSDRLAAQVCPTGALSQNDILDQLELRPELCINCLLCVTRCPIGSIQISEATGEVKQILKADSLMDDREVIFIRQGQLSNPLTEYFENIGKKRLMLSSMQRISAVLRFERIISPGNTPRIDQDPFYIWVRNVLREFGYSVAYTGGAGMKTRSDVTITSPYPVAIEVKSPEEGMPAKSVRQTADAASQLFRKFRKRVYTCIIGQHTTSEVLNKAEEHRQYMLNLGVEKYNIPIIESKVLIYLFFIKDVIGLTPENMEPIFLDFHGKIGSKQILRLVEDISSFDDREMILNELTKLEI